MISHTVLLLSNAMCKFKDEIPEFKPYFEQCHPGDVEDLIQDFMKSRILNTIKKVSNLYLWENRDDDAIVDKITSIKMHSRKQDLNSEEVNKIGKK